MESIFNSVERGKGILMKAALIAGNQMLRDVVASVSANRYCSKAFVTADERDQSASVVTRLKAVCGA